MSTNNVFLDYFDKVYIINLPSRQDRRREMEEQLHKIQVDAHDPKIYFFPAVRPADAGEFSSIGARGCFSSHLGVLKHAQENGYKRIVILEDDLDFSSNFLMRIQSTISALEKEEWCIFYGGYLNDLPTGDMQPISCQNGVAATHFVAFQQPEITNLVQYLTRMMGRKGGDPEGGPMHVDGAYSWYRAQHPDSTTLVAVPPLGHQRSSRTDIHQNKWYDNMPITSHLVALLRRFKNRFNNTNQ